MATRETRRERGRRRGDETIRRIVGELRQARQAAGLSQRALASEAGWTQSELHRFERAEFIGVALPRLCALASALDLEMSATLHPIGEGLRDKGQQALLKRIDVLIHASYSRNREVPFPKLGDLRSWDMVIRLDDYLVGLEAETRVRDIQALVRRIRQREQHGGVDDILVVLADTAHNRAVIDELRESLGQPYATSPRELLGALRAGKRLPGSGVVLL
jgi:transcriptional regulator with XRE-family HTH domain